MGDAIIAKQPIEKNRLLSLPLARQYSEQQHISPTRVDKACACRLHNGGRIKSDCPVLCIHLNISHDEPSIWGCQHVYLCDLRYFGQAVMTMSTCLRPLKGTSNYFCLFLACCTKHVQLISPFQRFILDEPGQIPKSALFWSNFLNNTISSLVRLTW